MTLFKPSSGSRVRINVLDDLGSFLASWDDPAHPANSGPCSICRTAYGNINRSGVVDYESESLSRWHPKFQESIEPGVRTLVNLLATDFNWITYTSCEGHAYTSTRLVPVERHVGIAPRNDAERGQIILALAALRDATISKTRFSPVEIMVIVSVLESTAYSIPVVDLCFWRRRLRSWNAYFKALDEVYTATLEELRRLYARRGL